MAGNWKMNLSCREASTLATEILESVRSVTNCDVAIFPTAVSLQQLAGICDESPVAVGAQNLYTEESGAFTGELSGEILRSAGAQYVLVGHSERRHILGEDDAFLNAKMKAARRAGLKPVLCVGETLEQRESGATESVITAQVAASLAGLNEDDMANVTIAYEPVWAIGTGKTATPEMAQEVHASIRAFVAGLYTRAIAEEMRIQYGGSVKPGNVDELMAMPDVDGALVGGASMEAASFARIVKFEMK